MSDEVFSRSWERAWRSLVTQGDGGALRQSLINAYAEPQRKYHTLQHLAECLSLFEVVGSLASHPGEVEMALWFHDAVYDVKGSGNEERSAQWAVQALMAAGVNADAVSRVSDLVLATRHSVLPSGADECVLVDIDLAILGADRARFDEYERQIREEYAHVPGLIFRHKRRQILRSFLKRPAIYATPAMRERFEQAARGNLQRVT